MIDWLKKRLSGSQKESDRYIELAEAIQEFWEQDFDPELEKIINLRSIYAADIEGQKEIVSELGGYYEYDLPDKNIPISVAFRKLELFQKDTEIPLVASLKRLEWMPNGNPFMPGGAKHMGLLFILRMKLNRHGLMVECCH